MSHDQSPTEGMVNPKMIPVFEGESVIYVTPAVYLAEYVGRISLSYILDDEKS